MPPRPTATPTPAPEAASAAAKEAPLHIVLLQDSPHAPAGRVARVDAATGRDLVAATIARLADATDIELAGALLVDLTA